MREQTRRALAAIAKQEKQLDALYRKVAQRFGLADCAMWVLYFLATGEGGLAQQDLTRRMMFPKQTVNSAVSALAKRGLLSLAPMPGRRNRKTLTLTPGGRELAAATVDRLSAAEGRAVERMGSGAAARFVELYGELFAALRAEFERDGLLP